MDRTTIDSGTEWERDVGYSRALRLGDRVLVAGTTATDDAGTVVAAGDAYEQTMHAIDNVEHALERAGARLEHVVRTRLFVTDIDQWEAYGRAHGERFGSIRPATTMVEVQALIEPSMLVEIEVEAVR